MSDTTKRLEEIKARLAKLPPGFWTRGAVGSTGRNGENAANTVMDCNGKVICDSLNADLVCIERVDDEDGCRYYDRGTEPHFEFIANCKEDVPLLLAEIDRRMSVTPELTPEFLRSAEIEASTPITVGAEKSRLPSPTPQDAGAVRDAVTPGRWYIASEGEANLIRMLFPDVPAGAKIIGAEPQSRTEFGVTVMAVLNVADVNLQHIVDLHNGAESQLAAMAAECERLKAEVHECPTCGKACKQCDCHEALVSSLRRENERLRDAIGVCVPTIIRCFLDLLPPDADIDRDVATKVLERVNRAMEETSEPAPLLAAAGGEGESGDVAK